MTSHYDPTHPDYRVMRRAATELARHGLTPDIVGCANSVSYHEGTSYYGVPGFEDRVVRVSCHRRRQRDEQLTRIKPVAHVEVNRFDDTATILELVSTAIAKAKE